MQTFLPFRDFAASARTLDQKRLGKQRVENLQILSALLDSSKGWQNHPAVRMWRGHEYALLIYQFKICDEWTSRGYRDTCRDKAEALFTDFACDTRTGSPPWLGSKPFHESHQSNLLRKDFAHYGPLFPDTPDYLPYAWPV